MSKRWSAGVGVALALVFVSPANADMLRFTATSGSSGVLGYFDYDSSVFDGSSFQSVTNDYQSGIYFDDPLSSVLITTAGPATDLTFFDSTGPLPTVVGGGGLSGGSWLTGGLFIAGTSYISFTGGGASYSDVSWSTSMLSSAVPEPGTWAMMLLGFGAVGFAVRRRRSRTALASA